MHKKLLASVGIAGLLLASAPAAAFALTNSVVDAPGGVIAVDEDSTNTDTIIRNFVVTDPGTVTGVTISVDFNSSVNSRCDAIVDDENDYTNYYSDELQMVLTSPTGVQSSLVLFGTYTAFDADAPMPVSTVVFDDAAADVVGTTNGQIPVSGTFKPSSLLSVMNGALAAGTWTLSVADADNGAAQCYYGATLNVVTDSPDPVVVPPVTAPTPPAKIETAA